LATLKTSDATANYVLKELKHDEYRKGLWKGRAYLPFSGASPNSVEFPDSTDIPKEIRRLKKRLKEQATKNGNRLDLRLRDTNYKAGMFLGKPKDASGVTADSLTVDQIKVLIKNDVMEDYYSYVGKRKPIPHDGVRLNQELWLPGLFVIDQIFQALLNETWTKCVAYNKVKDPAAKDDLNSFVDGISKGAKQLNADAAKYLPFINYKGKAKNKTWINLITDADDYVVGALIHVHDWAGGTHSNGTGMP
jgi:hypothetical protein